MQKEYIAPEWAAPPKSDVFSLDVLKDGSIIENIKLNDLDHFHVGRQRDTCEITLEHPSISRLHAVLQFRQDGALMILDMKSTHGTFVNKEKVSSEIYQRLYVGDIVQFGSSTRKYIVCGPESEMVAEYESANLTALRQKLTAKSEEIRKKTFVGASWGIGEDPSDEENDDEAPDEELPDYVKRDPNYARKYGDKYTSTLRKDEMNERDAELIDKLKTKERKIQNMQEENRRIFMKENSQLDGLTEGQKTAIERNDRRIAALQDEIEELEMQIRGKNASRAQTAGKVVKKSNKYDFDNSEEILDTTQQTADASTNWRLRKHATSTPTTRASSVSYEELIQQSSALETHLKRVVNSISQLETEESNMATTDDALELYMQQERRNEIESSLALLRKEKQDLETKQKQNEKFLKVAMPDVDSLKRQSNKSDNGSTSTSTVDNRTSSASCTVASAFVETAEAVVESGFAVTTTAPATGAKTVDISHTANEVSSTSSPEENISLVGMLDDRESVRNVNVEENSLPQDTKIYDSEHRDESSSPSVLSEKSTEEPVRKKMKGPLPAPVELRPKKRDEEKAVFNSRVLQDGDAVWMPPKNQSGDGRTQLNDKYGY